MQQPTQAPPTAPTPTPQPPKKSSALKWVLIILAIIIVLGLIAGVGCWFVARKALKTIEEEAVKLEEQIPKITIPEGVIEEEEVTLPSADVTGNDITEVPRYPGSVRTAWNKYEESEKVSYQAKATAAEVGDYYTKLLAEKGWTLTSSTEMDLVFEKEPARCSIVLYDSDGLTDYSIKYWPEY